MYPAMLAPPNTAWGCLITVCMYMYVKYMWHAYPRKSGAAVVSYAKGLYIDDMTCTVSTVVLYIDILL